MTKSTRQILVGSLKVWDFGSGQEIKSKPGRGSEEQDLSILGLQFCEFIHKRCIVVLGWNNKLQLFEDTNELSDLALLFDFSDYYAPTLEGAAALGVDGRGSVFNSKTPLPEIGSAKSSRGSAQVTSIFKKVGPNFRVFSLLIHFLPMVS